MPETSSAADVTTKRIGTVWSPPFVRIATWQTYWPSFRPVVSIVMLRLLVSSAIFFGAMRRQAALDST